jgi:DNA-binding MarR family transcriptional regulator
MTDLAAQTNARLPRLSHVVHRLEDRGLVERFTSPENRRATNTRLTDDGWGLIRASAPGHVDTVRRNVIDALSTEQVGQLTTIADAILRRVDPTASMAAMYRRYDEQEVK